MRLEPTTDNLRVFGLRRNFVKAFLDLDFFQEVLVVGPFLARAV